MVPLGALRTLALALTPSIPALTDGSRCHPRACLHSDLFRVSRGSSHPRTPEHVDRWVVGISPTMTSWYQPSESEHYSPTRRTIHGSARVLRQLNRDDVARGG